MPTQPKDTRGECERCGGSGEVECCQYHKYGCPVCEGTGTEPAASGEGWEAEFDTMIVGIGFDEPTLKERRKRHLDFIRTQIAKAQREAAASIVAAVENNDCDQKYDCSCDAAARSAAEKYIKE